MKRVKNIYNKCNEKHASKVCCNSKGIDGQFISLYFLCFLCTWSTCLSPLPQWHVSLIVPRRYSHIPLNKCLIVSVCLLCFCNHLQSCCFLDNVLVLCCSGNCLLCMLCFLHELFPLIKKIDKKNCNRSESYQMFFFVLFKNIVHSLQPGETPSYSASHQALNYVQRSYRKIY